MCAFNFKQIFVLLVLASLCVGIPWNTCTMSQKNTNISNFTWQIWIIMHSIQFEFISTYTLLYIIEVLKRFSFSDSASGLCKYFFFHFVFLVGEFCTHQLYSKLSEAINFRIFALQISTLSHATVYWCSFDNN